MKSKLALPTATFFGIGYAPFAPGTAGSVAALALAWGLRQWLGWGPVHFAVLCAVMLAPAVWAADAAARELKRKDPGQVVIDEVLGQWITLAGLTAFNWKSWLGALLLFRLFDIWKPAPVRQLERLPGGIGIVADDVMAGIYAAVVLYLAGCFNLY